MRYEMLSRVFPYVVHAEPETLREIVRYLTEPEPDYVAGGSSFALTARPAWALWLSVASARRVQARFPAVDGIADWQLWRHG